MSCNQGHPVFKGAAGAYRHFESVIRTEQTQHPSLGAGKRANGNRNFRDEQQEEEEQESFAQCSVMVMGSRGTPQPERKGDEDKIKQGQAGAGDLASSDSALK